MPVASCPSPVSSSTDIPVCDSSFTPHPSASDPDIRALNAAIERTDALLANLRAQSAAIQRNIAATERLRNEWRSMRDTVLADLLEDGQALDLSVMRLHDEIRADVHHPSLIPHQSSLITHPSSPSLPPDFIDTDPDGQG